MISKDTPAPRLLSTVVPERRERPPEHVSIRSRLKGVSLFSGNGRAIFVGMIVGAIVLSTIGVVYVRHQQAQRQAEEKRKLLEVSTKSISSPAPIVVHITPDLIHVSAISLGQPRLAIINGQLVGEGEQFTVPVPGGSIAVTLRVVKISDGRIDLSDGTQVILARPETSHAKP